MRIGKPIVNSADSGVLDPDMPAAPNTRIKYALLGSAIPLAILVGSGLVARHRAHERAIATIAVTDPGQRIELPRGGAGAGFQVGQLIRHIEESGRDYIIIGQINCALADHPKPSSLDYWLRENFAKNKEVRQATIEVIRQLLATGFFEQVRGLRCPDSGDPAVGLRLKAPVEVRA